MLNPFNYTVNDIKKNIVRRDTWGDYLVIDNFLKASVFEELCKDFNYWKTEDDGIWSGQENPRVWRFTEPKGMNLIIGGAGTEVSHFDKLCSLSKTWKEFIDDSDIQFCQLIVRNGAGCFIHKRCGRGRFGKGNHVANIVCTSQ